MPALANDNPTPLVPAKDHQDYYDACEMVRAAVRAFCFEHQREIVQFIVFGPNTKDHPGMYLARAWTALPMPQMWSLLIRAADLATVRGLLPAGMRRLGPHSDDDVNILEIWI